LSISIIEKHTTAYEDDVDGRLLEKEMRKSGI